MRPCENGWWEGFSTSQLRRWAVERQEQGDRDKPNDMENVAPLQKRCRGFVAERLFHGWLAGRVEFTPHGGTDALPDVEIASRRVGVRLCASHRQFQPNYLIYIFDRHKGLCDERFFVGFEETTRRYLLLGGITETAFLARAEYVEAGTEMCAGFVAVEPVWKARAYDLETPADWLTRLGGTNL